MNKIIKTTKLTILSLAFFFGFSYVYAWTAPTVNPPNGNTAAPINTGVTPQVKTSQLTASGFDMPANSYYKYNGANFAMASTALYNYFTGGSGNLTMTGPYNTANGFQALLSNTTGFLNTANGAQALYSNTTGLANTANGLQALYFNTTGGGNTTNGFQSLYFNTTGSDNTANGEQSLTWNTTGFSNTANGNRSLYFNTTGSNNTANGDYSLYSNTTSSNNTANGVQSLTWNTTGFSNTANGSQSLYSNITGSNNTAIGYKADVSSGDLSNATAIGANAIVDASNKVRIGDSSVTVIGGQVGWSVLSDARLKKNISDSNLGLRFILKLKPVEYNYIAKGQEGIRYTGLIAQDVEKTLKELNTDFSGLVKPQSEKGFYELRYAEFVVPLIKSTQEQQKQIDDLKSTNNKQQTEIDELHKALQDLKKVKR